MASLATRVVFNNRNPKIKRKGGRIGRLRSKDNSPPSKVKISCLVLIYEPIFKY